MNKARRVLVTGGAGFIGANLVRVLLGRGYEVTILDDLSASSGSHVEELPVEFVRGDILDPTTIEQLVPGSYGIIHLAAQAGVPTSLEDPRRDSEVNVTGTLNLLEACRNSCPDARFVFASSNAPLGRQEPPATEDKAPLPVSPYGASKLAGEAYCLAYHGSWGVGTVVLRFANVYGPFSGHKSSVVARFFHDIMSEDRIIIHGDGHQTRDFLYVGDLCNVIVLAMERKISGEVFQIATGIETSILELSTLVQEVVERKLVLEHAPARAGDVQKSYSTVTKVEEVLGWHSTVELKEGLQATWKWFTSQRETEGFSASEGTRQP